MNTLGEDILALQKRLLEKTGLSWELHLFANEKSRIVSAEQAMRVGEIMTTVIGGPARILEYTTTAAIEISTPSIEATIYCKGLLGKANA